MRRHSRVVAGRVLVEALEERALMAATVGSLDVVTTWPNGMPFQVQGWAFDADLGPNGVNPVEVRLDIDGFPALTQRATVARPDLVPVVGSAAHGYSFTVAPLPPGTHTLRVVAFDEPFGSEIALGVRTVTVETGPLGVLDTFDAANGIRGWAFDPLLPTASVPIQVVVDGTIVATQTASGVRPDLVPFFGSANHGFSLDLPTLSPGPHTVAVYALPLGAGGATLLGTFGATPPGPPFGTLDAANGSIIGGWAVDPDSVATGARVRVDIDGVPFRTLTTDIVRPDLVQFGPGAYGFQLATPAVGVGQHTVEMYAIDTPTGEAVLIGRQTFTLEQRPPIGNVDVLTATAVTTQILGWALDPDSPGRAVQIRIDVDGLPAIAGSASGDRPDLEPVFGTRAHGFSVTLPSVGVGNHRVDVYGIDVETGTAVLLESSVVTVAA